MRIEAGKEYRSRRGERVLVTEVEPGGLWPVHFIVMDGRYKGVGRRDGSRLTIDGRATLPTGPNPTDHLNDLVAEWPAAHGEGETRNARRASRPLERANQREKQADTRGRGAGNLG
jgi:hypothetical protein